MQQPQEASTSFLNPAHHQPHRTPSNGSSNSGLTYASNYSSDSQARAGSRSPGPGQHAQDRATAPPPRGDSRPAMRSQTLPPDQGEADYYQYRIHGQANIAQPQWGAPPPGGGYDLPAPRPPGMYAQQNHSSPTLAFKGRPSSGASPPLDASDAPPLPAMDDISIGLESMRFQQRDRDSAPSRMTGANAKFGRQPNSRHSDQSAIGVGQDGAMEIRSREGNTASVYSVDSGFSHASGSGTGDQRLHGKKTSQSSLRAYGGQGDDGSQGAPPIEYGDDRRGSGGSYLPYDQPSPSEYGDYPEQMRQQQQGQSFYQGGEPYYSQQGGPNQHPPQQQHSYGPPQNHYGQQHQHPQQQQHHPPPTFQPQPPHNYDYSAAAAQNPYYAAATGQLGFPDGGGYQQQQYGGGANPYPLNRALSSASSMTSLAPSLSNGGGGGLSRSASSVNMAVPARRPGPTAPTAAGTSGPPITKASVDEYRGRIKADPDPEAQFNFAKYLIEAAKKISSSASGDEKSAKKYRDALLAESLKLIKRLATQGAGLGKPAYADAQFFLANCLGNGSLGLQVDHEKAYNLYVQASKQNHSSATYRTAVCNEVGAGTRRDHARAVLFYRKASALGDTAGMYKLGMILLNGLLGQQRNVKEAVAWLKRAASQADEDNPHALHELGLLYEKAPPPGQPGPLASIIPFDPAQARELFTQAGQFGYPPSQFKLGACYEYGTLTCPVDPRRSIAWYTRAAERGDAEAELALSGWYLTGSEGVLKQSDSEAYLWARRAANKGLPKAEYAVGYYSEVGIGVKQDLEEAKRWYMRAAAQGNKRAMQRLSELREIMKKDGKAKPKERDTRKR